MSNPQLQQHAKKIGREDVYLKYREQLLNLMNSSEEESQEDYAAFLFAFSSVANEIQRKRKR